MRSSEHFPFIGLKKDVAKTGSGGGNEKLYLLKRNVKMKQEI